MDERRAQPGVAIFDGLLSSGDLEAIELVTADLEFEPQDAGRGGIAARERAMTNSPELPALLWDRLAPHVGTIAGWFSDRAGPMGLEAPLDQWSPIGCNPRSRFYRYRPGAEFRPHVDEPWRPNESKRSFLSVLVYLPAGGCEGGETVIAGEVIHPEDGRVVVFDHGLQHLGAPVERGRKLVLRSDVVAELASV